MTTGNEVLMITGLLIACIVLFAITIKRVKQKKIISGILSQNQDRVLEACAIVLSVETTGIEIDKATVLKLQVQVLPMQGRNFISELMVPVTGRSFVAGEKINILYSSANSKTVRLASNEP